MEYQYHDLANLFPLIEGKEFDDLVADIRANGLLQPIVLYDGKILDGRNRYRACLKAGRQPEFELFEGNEDECKRFVVSENLRRRHLTESQRAIVAARMSGNGKFAIAEAAEVMQVSPRSAHDAKVVLLEGHKKVREAVERGEVSVSRAASDLRAKREAKAGRPRGNAKVIQLYRGMRELIELCDASSSDEIVRHWPIEPGKLDELRRVVKNMGLLAVRLEEVEHVASAVGA